MLCVSDIAGLVKRYCILDVVYWILDVVCIGYRWVGEEILGW